jgi:hypothetical protein
VEQGRGPPFISPCSLTTVLIMGGCGGKVEKRKHLESPDLTLTATEKAGAEDAVTPVIRLVNQ